MRFLEGLFTVDATVTAAASAATTFDAVEVSIRIFDPNDAPGKHFIDTEVTVTALCCVPGDFTKGCYAAMLELPRRHLPRHRRELRPDDP